MQATQGRSAKRFRAEKGTPLPPGLGASGSLTEQQLQGIEQQRLYIQNVQTAAAATPAAPVRVVAGAGAVQSAITTQLATARQQIASLTSLLEDNESERQRLIRVVNTLQTQIASSAYNPGQNNPLVEYRAQLLNLQRQALEQVTTESTIATLQERVHELEAELEQERRNTERERARADQVQAQFTLFQQSTAANERRTNAELDNLINSIQNALTIETGSRTVVAQTISALSWNAFGVLALQGVTRAGLRAYRDLTGDDYVALLELLVAEGAAYLGRRANETQAAIDLGQDSVDRLSAALDDMDPTDPMRSNLVAMLTTTTTELDRNRGLYASLTAPEIPAGLFRQYNTVMRMAFEFLRATSVFDDDNALRRAAYARLPPGLQPSPFLAPFAIAAGLTVLPPLQTPAAGTSVPGAVVPNLAVPVTTATEITVPRSATNVFYAWAVARVMRLLWYRIAQTIDRIVTISPEEIEAVVEAQPPQTVAPEQAQGLALQQLQADSVRQLQTLWQYMRLNDALFPGDLTNPGVVWGPFAAGLRAALVALLRRTDASALQWAWLAGDPDPTVIPTMTTIVTRFAAEGAPITRAQVIEEAVAEQDRLEDQEGEGAPAVHIADIRDSLRDLVRILCAYFNAQSARMIAEGDTIGRLCHPNVENMEEEGADAEAEAEEATAAVNVTEAARILTYVSDLFMQFTLPPWNTDTVAREPAILQAIRPRTAPFGVSKT